MQSAEGYKVPLAGLGKVTFRVFKAYAGPYDRHGAEQRLR